jgi:hypothetical protein
MSLNHHVKPKIIRGALFNIFITATLAACASMDSYLAISTPISPTETPLPTPTVVWFPATSTPTLQFFATNEPTPEKRPGVQEIFLTDNFTNKTLWDTATSNDASADVNANRLNLSAQSGFYMFSLRQDLVIENFYAEITAKPGICRGEDSYGMLVRASAVAYYRFALTCDGDVGAERASIQTRQKLQEPIPSGDVPPGAPGEVRIGVWAVGREMRLFLNGRYQFTVSDTNYPSGTIGAFVQARGETPVVVSFSNLTVQTVNYQFPTPVPTATPKK